MLTFELSGPSSFKQQSPEALHAAYRQLHAMMASTAGVDSVSFTGGATPMRGDNEEYFGIVGRPMPPHQTDLPMTLEYLVEPDYLQVMQIALKRGRFFTPADNENAASVIVIDESLAEKYFPDSDPIGQYLDLNTNPADPDKIPNPRIIGVVGHVNQWGLDSDASSPLHAQVYLPIAQIPGAALQRIGLGVDVCVRLRAPAAAVLPALRSRIHEFNAEAVVHSAENMEKVVADSIASHRFVMTLLGIFAALALVLAGIGIYGVLAYMVGRRTREIGVRMALGAQRWDVLRLVMKDGAHMIAAGVLLGLFGALWLTRLMRSLLFGVNPSDPLTFAAVAALLCVIALLACYLPARRAMKVDPIEALRHE